MQTLQVLLRQHLGSDWGPLPQPSTSRLCPFWPLLLWSQTCRYLRTDALSWCPKCLSSPSITPALSPGFLIGVRMGEWRTTSSSCSCSCGALRKPFSSWENTTHLPSILMSHLLRTLPCPALPEDSSPPLHSWAPVGLRVCLPCSCTYLSPFPAPECLRLWSHWSLYVPGYVVVPGMKQGTSEDVSGECESWPMAWPSGMCLAHCGVKRIRMHAHLSIRPDATNTPSCCCLIAKSCPTLCDPMDYSMPSFPVLHFLRVYSNSCLLSQWCHLTISSSITRFSSRPHSFPASGSFPRVGSSHQVAKVLELQLQHPPFQWILRVDFL